MKNMFKVLKGYLNILKTCIFKVTNSTGGFKPANIFIKKEVMCL